MSSIRPAVAFSVTLAPPTDVMIYLLTYLLNATYNLIVGLLLRLDEVTSRAFGLLNSRAATLCILCSIVCSFPLCDFFFK